ncbi:uncharacterized protein LOC120290916 isoform X1 [Eucalyptus grandis]|uniref:uncharacterized protein LOC120290916 isoform X1 n=1 Tax=Eucalyptus grandis TaxID=71139 RepID=UPI00192ECB32|nr:uncharacterized protein LOC120290916 isoform X1 [Eucalyptus grandis]
MRSCSGWRRLLFCLPLVFLLPHLLSGGRLSVPRFPAFVMELHREPTVGDQHKKARNKFDHLVLGPVAGEHLPNRLQCQGVKALNKTHFSASSNRSYVAESIAFVTVFTVYNSSDISKTSGSSDVTTVGNSSYNKVERSIAILNVFINFIQVIS